MGSLVISEIDKPRWGTRASALIGWGNIIYFALLSGAVWIHCGLTVPDCGAVAETASIPRFMISQKSKGHRPTGIALVIGQSSKKQLQIVVYNR